MCLSKHTWDKLSINRETSYHNDVVIRDLSALNNIKHEWLNNELIFIHMRGIDDSLKSIEKDFEIS